MTAAANYTEPGRLVTLTWPDATHRLTTLSAPYTYGGQVFATVDNAAGQILAVGKVSESYAEVGNTTITLALTATTLPWVVGGKTRRLQVSIREIALALSSGSAVVQTPVWAGWCIGHEIGGQQGAETVELTLALREIFQRGQREDAVYSDQGRARLVGPGDLAMQYIGERVQSPYASGYLTPGTTPGGVGGFVDGDAVWIDADVLARGFRF